MAVTAPSLEKMNDTVQTLRGIVEKMDSCSQAELNRYEDKIRNEFQVIEALIAYVGRDIYDIAQKRRIALRTQNLREIQQMTDNFRKEMNGTTGSSGDTGDGVGTDKPSGVEQQSDTKAKRPSRQSKSKK